MLTTAFWALVAIDSLALVVVFCMAAFGRSGPEGPVGAWIIIIPILMVAGFALAGYLSQSTAVRIAGICFLTLPFIIAVAVPTVTALRKRSVERYFSGDQDFKGVQLDLAHAIRANDAKLVRSLVSKAGDLNQATGSQTILEFAICGLNDPITPEKLDIIQALLDGGANPDRPPLRVRPLKIALYHGNELVAMLLKAGATVNHMEDGRPLWWESLMGEPDHKIPLLRLFLDHGADLTLRTAEGGPVGFAAYYTRSTKAATWQAVWLLVERGAPWRDEQQYGVKLSVMIDAEIKEFEAGKEPIPEALQKLKERFD